MVTGASFGAATVIGAAAIRFFEIGAAHGEHRTAAIATLEKSRIYIIVFLLTAIVICGTALEQRPYRGEFTVGDDRLMMVLDDDMIALIALDIFAVDLLAGVFARAHRADVEVVFQDSFYRGNCPSGLDLSLVILALGFFALTLRHTRRGDAFVSQVVSDLLVAPAVLIQLEDGANDLGFRRHCIVKLHLYRNGLNSEFPPCPKNSLLLKMYY